MIASITKKLTIKNTLMIDAIHSVVIYQGESINLFSSKANECSKRKIN